MSCRTPFGANTLLWTPFGATLPERKPCIRNGYTVFFMPVCRCLSLNLSLPSQKMVFRALFDRHLHVDCKSDNPNTLLYPVEAQNVAAYNHVGIWSGKLIIIIQSYSDIRSAAIAADRGKGA